MAHIIRLNDGERDWYLEWSTIVDAPVTYGVSREEYVAYYRERYGTSGMEQIAERLARVDAKGTSALGDASVEETVRYNRAGPGESCIPVAEIIRRYCHERDEEGFEEEAARTSVG